MRLGVGDFGEHESLRTDLMNPLISATAWKAAAERLNALYGEGKSRPSESSSNSTRMAPTAASIPVTPVPNERHLSGVKYIVSDEQTRACARPERWGFPPCRGSVVSFTRN